MEQASDVLGGLASDDADRQQAAIEAAVEREVREAIPALVGLLSAPDEFVRAGAAEALASLADGDDDAVVDALIGRLGDAEAMVRSEVVDALGVLAAARAVEPLERCLIEDKIDYIRASAAEALGVIAAPASLTTLMSVVRGTDDDVVRAYAAMAVGRVDGAERDALARLAEIERSPHVLAELLGALARLGDGTALPRLATLLADSEEPQTTVVLNVLEDLREALEAPVWEASRSAVDRALDALVRRSPSTRGHVDRIRGSDSGPGG